MRYACGFLTFSCKLTYITHFTKYSCIRHGIFNHRPIFYSECHFNYIKALLQRSMFRGFHVLTVGDPTPKCNMVGDLRRECGLTPHISVNTDVDHNPIFVGKIGGSWPPWHHPLTTRLKCYERDKVAEEIHMIRGIWMRHDGICSTASRSARVNMNSYRKPARGYR